MRYEIGCMEPVVEVAQLTVQSRGLLRRWQEVASAMEPGPAKV